MKLVNCPRCSRAFTRTGPAQCCTDCEPAETREVSLVKDHLFAFPHANIHEVSEATSVPVSTVRRFLKQSVLAWVPGDDAGSFRWG